MTMIRCAADSFPIPLLEKIRDGKAKARQEMLGCKIGSNPEQLALVESVTALNGFGIGIDYPGNLRAAPEIVFEPLVDFGAGVIGREDLHREVGCGREEFPRGPLKTHADQPFFGYE